MMTVRERRVRTGPTEGSSDNKSETRKVLNDMGLKSPSCMSVGLVFPSSYSVLSSSCRTSRSRRTRSVPSLVTRLPAPFGRSPLRGGVTRERHREGCGREQEGAVPTRGTEPPKDC